MATTHAIRTKRAYEPASKDDGCRVLVDRLWPRGVSKVRAQLDAWLRDVAPSAELRCWFGHDPGRWDEFVRRYHTELATPERQAALTVLEGVAAKGPLTLVYAAKDTEHNEAEVLAVLLRHRSGQAAASH